MDSKKRARGPLRVTDYRIEERILSDQGRGDDNTAGKPKTQIHKGRSVLLAHDSVTTCFASVRNPHSRFENAENQISTYGLQMNALMLSTT